MVIDDIIQFILEPDSTNNLFLFVKSVFLIFNLFLIIFTVYAFFKASWINKLFFWDMKEYLSYKHHSLGGIEKQWAEIKEKLEGGQEAEAKLAVIEADNLLNKTLKGMGYIGATLDEKLNKLSDGVLVNINEIKEGRKVCSDIVHDPSYRLDSKEAEKVLNVIEKTLINLQAL